MFKFSKDTVFQALECLLGFKIPESDRDMMCSEFEKRHYRKVDDLSDDLMLVMSLEEISDVSLGNPDPEFPLIRETTGRRKCLANLTLSSWCEQVAEWANNRQGE